MVTQFVRKRGYNVLLPKVGEEMNFAGLYYEIKNINNRQIVSKYIFLSLYFSYFQN